MHFPGDRHVRFQTPSTCCPGIRLLVRDVLRHGHHDHHGHHDRRGHHGRHGHRGHRGRRGRRGHHGRAHHDWCLLRGTLGIEHPSLRESLAGQLGLGKIVKCLTPYRLQQVVRTNH